MHMTQAALIKKIIMCEGSPISSGEAEVVAEIIICRLVINNLVIISIHDWVYDLFGYRLHFDTSFIY